MQLLLNKDQCQPNTHEFYYSLQSLARLSGILGNLREAKIFELVSYGLRCQHQGMELFWQQCVRPEYKTSERAYKSFCQRWQEHMGAWPQDGFVLSHTSALYPLQLKDLADYPPLLYLRGNVSLLKRDCVSVVGARKVSEQARQLAYQLAASLAQQSIVVVSGGAIGCDIAAHLAAAHHAKNSTAVIQPGGLRFLQPRSHEGYFDFIIDQGGLLISEQPWNAIPRRYHYPIRNRLIAAMSKVCVIVQASMNSGAMSTAEWAVDLERKVIAFDPHTPDIRFAGNQLLISQGATSVPLSQGAQI